MLPNGFVMNPMNQQYVQRPGNFPQYQPHPIQFPNQPFNGQYISQNQPFILQPQSSVFNQNLAPQQPPRQIFTNVSIQSKERFAFSQRTEPMKWQLAESLEVDQISRKGDLQSVLFYMEQFAFANIRDEDYKQFGSKGAMNAFLLLQLGCEYLLAQKAMNPPHSTNEADSQLLAQYNQNIKAATESVKSHKAKIAKLEEQNAQLREDRKKEMEVINQLREKLKRAKIRLGCKNKKKMGHETTDTEPGALHDQTAYRELNKADKKLKHGKKKDDISDGELSIDNSTSFGESNDTNDVQITSALTDSSIYSGTDNESEF